MNRILEAVVGINSVPTPPGVSHEFADRISRAFGDAGRRWLSLLPETIARCVRVWDLTLEAPFEDLSFQYVIRARRADASPVVLKLGVPRDELVGEVRALRLYAGRGVVRLVAWDHALGALLLERVEPGFELAELATVDDIAATRNGGAAVRSLVALGLKPETPAGGAISIGSVEGDWAQAFDGYRQLAGRGSGPLPADVIHDAERRFGRLLSSGAIGDRIMLHGDLHHHNILKSSHDQDTWIVIDPKGVVGEPACEVASFLRNPGSVFAHDDDHSRTMHRRVEAIASVADLDPLRIRDWGVVGAVISAIWCIEDDGTDLNPTVSRLPIACARWLAPLRFSRMPLREDH
ncbi:MAG: aminoglycoside/hydroxyurea antibiotic resistance kinase [Chloroflexi bacterium]|nr:aminoglycoside/hydroxyurea antibiotic resistance kinase [Chloroflexota bacterium]